MHDLKIINFAGSAAAWCARSAEEHWLRNSNPGCQDCAQVLPEERESEGTSGCLLLAMVLWRRPSLRGLSTKCSSQKRGSWPARAVANASCPGWLPAWPASRALAQRMPPPVPGSGGWRVNLRCHGRRSKEPGTSGETWWPPLAMPFWPADLHCLGPACGVELTARDLCLLSGGPDALPGGPVFACFVVPLWCLSV